MAFQPRDGSRQVFADTRRDETNCLISPKNETRLLLRRIQVETNSRQIDISGMQFETYSSPYVDLSRQNETLNFSRSRDKTGRDENSRLVSPRNEPRL